MNRKKALKKSALTQTIEEYASRSTIHGIGYLFDRGLGIVDRLLWLFVVVAFLSIASALTWNFWSQWRNEQVKHLIFWNTRSYAALRAADLDWIVGPGYSLGRVHSGEKP